MSVLWTDQDEEEYTVLRRAYHGRLLWCEVPTEREQGLLDRQAQIEQRAENSSETQIIRTFPAFDNQTLSIWHQYRDAELKPSRNILDKLFKFISGEYYFRYYAESTIKVWAETWKIAIQSNWVPRDSWIPVRARRDMVWFFEHWFADKTFWRVLVAENHITYTTAAEIRQAFQAILHHLQQRNRPDIVLTFMTLKNQRGCQVIKRQRTAFKCFFERMVEPPWYSWYQQHVALPQKLTVLVGAFGCSPIESSSPLYRAFSQHPLAERQLLRLILKMAFE